MELINKILGLLIAVFAASMVALTVGYVAHYDFGLSRLDIRRSALMGHLRPTGGDTVVRKAAKIQMTRVLMRVWFFFLCSPGVRVPPLRRINRRPFGA
jgi:hypothetical protein